MKLRMKQVAQLLALSASLVVFQPCQGKDESKPIVDVRFDAPYRQVEPSNGDEWAPTWGRNDVLYTGNDDGSSFGGVPANTIAFGKLEGNDPYQLKGTTISGMPEFKEPSLPGPEGAVWKTESSQKVGETLYRFAPCGSDAAGSTCLMKSSDAGKTWTVIKPLFQGTKFRSPAFITYRKASLAIESGASGKKESDFIYAASYSETKNGEDHYIIGRVPTEKLADANRADWSFRSDDGAWEVSAEKAGTSVNRWYLGPDNANWKVMNAYSVDGVLYMFVTRCLYPWVSGDPQMRHVFRDSSIIKSTDNGKTWTRSSEDNYSQPMFPGKRFGTPYFVWYGKDGAASVDNADKYVYAVSNNGHFEGGDDFVLGRVLRTKLANLSPADWSFYKQGDGMEAGNWTSSLDEAAPILKNPRQSAMTGMTYIEGLGRYVMPVWTYTHSSFAVAINKRDLSTAVQFFEAPKPWGPWTKFKTLKTGELGWYAPAIGQRFQTLKDSNTVEAFFYATGFLSKPEGGLDFIRYKFNYMPITLSTKPLKHKDPAFVGGR